MTIATILVCSVFGMYVAGYALVFAASFYEHFMMGLPQAAWKRFVNNNPTHFLAWDEPGPHGGLGFAQHNNDHCSFHVWLIEYGTAFQRFTTRWDSRPTSFDDYYYAYKKWVENGKIPFKDKYELRRW